MIDLLKSEQYIKEHRDETIKTMCDFAATDMLLFWSDRADISQRQWEIWQPFIDALQVKINISESLQIPDNELFLKFLRSKLSSLKDNELTAAFLAATKLKSVILGLSMLEEKNSIEEVFKAAFLEELYQNEFWGSDEEADKKRMMVKSELQKIREYLYK